MLTDFIRTQDLDIILLQEVVTPDSIEVLGYSAYSNVGSDMRGTAILVRRGLQVTDIQRVPTGRAVAVTCQGIRIVNIYAPSGTSRRADRERFYNADLSELLSTHAVPMLIGGDFNCTLSPIDTTGTHSTSNALTNIITGLNLVDMWTQDPNRPVYTHYTPQGASRLDRFYISKDEVGKKSGIETVPTAFTDHHAVVLRLAMPTLTRRKRCGRWKMDPTVVSDPQFRAALQREWGKWQTHKRYYMHIGEWWERHIKMNVRRLARRVECERSKEHKTMENHLYTCLYDILRADIPEAEKYPHLQKYKAKIVRLNARRREKILLDIHPKDRLDGEDLTLYQILKIRRRKQAREIMRIRDNHGREHTTPAGIAEAFVKYYTRTFQHIQCDGNAFEALMHYLPEADPTQYKDQLERPIEKEEVYRAIKSGAKRRAPGIDGMSLEFYAVHWELIQNDLTEMLNDMFLHKRITLSQKKGIIICLPKTNNRDTLDSYRPISLLNTEYKLLARIMATRLKPILTALMPTGQYCGIPGKSMLDALAAIRDVIAYHETEKRPMCIVTLDFQKAFDKIAHDYLFRILGRYGISSWFIDRIKAMYEGMHASVQINGALVGTIPINSGIRQGCPLSMCLYTLCLHPLILRLEASLPSLKIGRHPLATTVVAYADDVTLLVKDPEGLETIKEALQLYERASGAAINTQKSSTMAIAGWAHPPPPLQFPCTNAVVILGVTFHQTIASSSEVNWTKTIQAIRAQARRSFPRMLCLEQRIQYVLVCLLAKLWFLAQTFLPKNSHLRQITAVCQWYIWQAAIFRVPASTLQRPLMEGGWNLPSVGAKCRTLLYNRLRTTASQEGSVLAKVLKVWGLEHPIQNPPHLKTQLRKLEYLLHYSLDAAYIPALQPSGGTRLDKKYMYSTLYAMSKDSTQDGEMRITRKYPRVVWSRVWKNLHTNGLTPSVKSVWYAVIHDILPTHDRLASINLVPNSQCPRCTAEDSVVHRVLHCQDGPLQWTWTRQKIALILRTEARHIPNNWTTTPDMQLWPPQRHTAVIWILAHYVFYRLQNNRRMSLSDYIEYMRRARWKSNTASCRPKTGRYLEVLEWTF